MDLQEELNEKLFKILLEKYPEMVKEVFSQDMCDIDSSFLGFLEPYYYLYKIIPLDWEIVDFGCAYSPQAYYFRNHKGYTGVDSSISKRFKFNNGVGFVGKISEYVKLNLNKNKVFAICNNVPSIETDLVRMNYKDCFIYYVK